MELCKGNSFCNSTNDLQWCKNDTSWNQPTPINWKPVYLHSICTLKPQQDVIDFQGQWIEDTKRGNEIYQCLNRADENPFVRNKKNDTNWLEWVSKPCFDEGRRCLGERPDECVYTVGKFYLEKYDSPIEFITNMI